jgi:signal transduction histidine kinase
MSYPQWSDAHRVTGDLTSATLAPGSPIPALPLEGPMDVVGVDEKPSAGLTVERTGQADVHAVSTHRPGTLPVLMLATMVALVLVVTGVLLTANNAMSGAPWQPRLVILQTAGWISTTSALCVGLWWWRRAPANPTGRLLYLSGVCGCVNSIGLFWPYSAWATELTWAGQLTLPLVAMVVLGWPTGRPSRRIRRAVIGVAASIVLITAVGGVFRKSVNPSAEWPDPPHALFSVPEVWQILDPVQALIFTAIPAIATIVVLVRRRRAVPPAVRPLITPITTAGVLVAGSLIVVHVGYQVFGGLFPVEGADISTVRLLVLLGLYLDLAFVAVGVLVGATRRTRAVALGTRQMRVDLSSATPIVSPSAAAAAVVGDPTARVRYRRPDGHWIDSAGQLIGPITEDRRLLPVVDQAGEVTAGIEVNGSTPVPPLLADLAVSAITARGANELAAALADARRLEVRARSRDLVAATDTGRIDLERTLHDGAQQFLVGLALTAGLRDRQVGGVPGDQLLQQQAATEIIDQIDQVRREILELVDATAPAVLSAGLAGALRSLAAVSPIPISLHADGDIAGSAPVALGLYLAAGEVIANAVKHAAATQIEIAMTVDAARVRILFQDNGIGGVDAVPKGLADRVAALPGRVQINSPRGAGTSVRIWVQRADVNGGAW